jgi:hypothetical protein
MATKTLENAVEVKDLVRAVLQFGLTQKALAEMTGATERTVRNWQTTSAIRPQYEERLRELQEIILLLKETLTPLGVGQWFRAKNRLLKGRRPLEVLSEGHVEAVRAAAESYVEGSYV